MITKWMSPYGQFCQIQDRQSVLQGLWQPGQWDHMVWSVTCGLPIPWGLWLPSQMGLHSQCCKDWDHWVGPYGLLCPICDGPTQSALQRSGLPCQWAYTVSSVRIGTIELMGPCSLLYPIHDGPTQSALQMSGLLSGHWAYTVSFARIGTTQLMGLNGLFCPINDGPTQSIS